MLQAKLVIRNKAYTVVCNSIRIDKKTGEALLFAYDTESYGDDVVITRGKTTLVNVFETEHMRQASIPSNLPLSVLPETGDNAVFFIGSPDNERWVK